MLVAFFAQACDDDTAASDATNPSGPDATEEVDRGEDPTGQIEKSDRGGIPADWTARIATTWLHVDVGDMTAEASIWFEPSSARTVSLEAPGLDIDDVYDDDGAVAWEQRLGALHIAHMPASGPIHIDYHFSREKQGEGFAKNGSTVVWPYYCGNLFPCRSGPSDGIQFELSLSGYASGQKAIYPEALIADAPSYTLAFAIGRYTCQDLGKTAAGTVLQVCWLPNGKTKALKGTRALTAAFDWLEQNIGSYTFGKRAGSVAVAWGPSTAGGMEHHPYWHVATSEMDLPITHVHEAVHGWYGTGIRMQCWEDFVLSEGTTSYLAARALGAVTDAATEDAIWADYRETLMATLEDEDIVAWPSTCGKVDILKGGLFSNIVYMKGAFFWRAVADALTPEVLDAVLARFYETHVGTATTMTALVAAIQDDTGFDPGPLVQHWLLARGNPFD